jgi:hypothetical protein
MPEDKRIIAYTHDSIIDVVPTKPKEFFEWWTDKLNAVPPEYRHTTKIELEVMENYDYHTLELQVIYTRPESREEAAKREDEELMRESRVRAKELEQLKRLKAKYGEV